MIPPPGENVTRAPLETIMILKNIFFFFLPAFILAFILYLSLRFIPKYKDKSIRWALQKVFLFLLVIIGLIIFSEYYCYLTMCRVVMN